MFLKLAFVNDKPMPIPRYGCNWPDGMSDLHIELWAFKDGTAQFGGDPDDKPFHFKQIVKMLWGPKSKKPYQWDPWTDRMLEGACEEKYLWLSGCAGSRKSTFGAVWALVNWLCAPATTLVLIASTSLTEARRRIWGQVEEYFAGGCESMAAMHKGASLPGKIISSVGKIRTEDGSQKFSDLCGIQLIAGDASHEKESLKKIGFHNKRVIMILDELTDLSPTLVGAARANLTVNPFFQLLGFGNFASIYDPLGVNAEPVGGWGSVTDECDQWKTNDGLCLRFDGSRSPNVLAGNARYLGQYGPDDFENHRKSLGEHSAAFWRMCRSFPCPEADANRVYSEADLVKGAVRDLVKWRDIPVKCAALDPAFATGGDKAMAYFGLLGVSIDGKQTLQVSEAKEFRDDVRIKHENKALQVAKKFRDECVNRGIAPENAGFDGSGGGVVFGSLLTEIWSHRLLSVQFGGAASERPASIKDRRPAKQVFQNRVSEIWFAGIDFVQSGQIKGLPAQCCAELVERRKHKQGNIISHNRIESKDEMKKRTGGKSPDNADAALVLLELCRERLGFRAVGMEGKQGDVHLDWKRRVHLANQVYKNARYEPEAIAA